MPVTARVNNVTYIVQPGEGLVVEDQVITAETIIENIKNDYNNSAVIKAQFVVTEELEEVADEAEPTVEEGNENENVLNDPDWNPEES